MITTHIGQTTPTTISIRGMDMARDILGKLDFVQAFHLCALGRLPTDKELDVLNALLVVSLDHGFTPSSLATRLAFLGAPESMASAVAAGLLGAGSRYLGASTASAEQLNGWTRDLTGDEPAQTFEAAARQIVQASPRVKLMGFGHPIHKDEDPRVPALREVARRNGFYGKAWRFADALAAALKESPKPLPLNASAAMGATIADMKLDPALAVAVSLIARSGGLIAHILEEKANPAAQQVWELVLRQSEKDRLAEARQSTKEAA